MVLTIAEAKKLTVPRLKEELTKRGLDSTGNKPELLARLTDSLHQAAEDLILNDTGDAHSLNEDILNDDLLGSIDGEVDAEKLLAAEPTLSTEEEKEEKPEEPKKEVVLTTPPANGGADDAQRARAIRFGLPLTAEILGSDSAKAARAQRFGLPEDAKRLSSDDAKAKRAERFGTNTSSSASGDDKEKKAARAARFGLPVGESADKHKEKLAERAKRFGGAVDDEETAAKKKARLERFGGKAE